MGHPTSGGHYALDVDPEVLRSTAGQVTDLADHVTTKGGKASATPGNIGTAWQGETATSIMGEMTALGGLMKGFAPQLASAASALTALAHDYEEAEVEVALLNTRHTAAHAAFDDAAAKASTTYDAASRDATGEGGQLGKVLRAEAEDARSSATGTASATLDKAVQELDTQFDELKLRLADQTRTAAGIVGQNVPSPVSETQLTDYASGNHPTRFEHPGLLDALSTYAAKETADRQEAAQQAAQSDLGHLDDVLSDEDSTTEETEAALAQLGGQSGDAYYAEAVVDELGPDGLNDLYDTIAQRMPSYGEVETIWTGLEKFNDTVANGLAQHDDSALATFAHTFMDHDQGPKRWALFSHSSYADGRTNAVGLTYANRIYAQDWTALSGFDPFTSMFNLAYGDEEVLDHLSGHSSGSDLAKVLAAASGEDREDMLFELMNTTTADGYQMNEDDFKQKAALFDGALSKLVDGGKESSDAVEAMLEVINQPAFPYGESVLPGVQEALDDPQAMAWIIQEIRYGDFSADTLTEAFQSVDIEVDDLVGRIISYEIAQGLDPNRLANDVGYLLGTDDLLGQTVSPEGVLKSLAGSVAGMNPVSGAAYGVFKELFDEMQKMEQNEQDWSDGWSDERAQRLLSFTICAASHGGPVPGFEAWLAASGRTQDSGSIVDFYQEQEDAGTPLFHELDDLRNDIDNARDES